jgi:hypothetical protein
VVADADEEHHRDVRVPGPRQQLRGPGPEQVLLGGHAGHGLTGQAGLVGAVDPVGRQPRPVHAFPVEQRGGQRFLMLLGPHHDVGAKARLAEQLRQRACVPERVDVVGHRGGAAERLVEVPLAIKQLAADGLPVGQVAVRLDPLAADKLPAARRHMLPDPVEQHRVGFLDPLVIRGRAGREAQVPIGVQAIGGRPEGGQHLAHSFTPVPDPDRVDMSVRDNHNLRMRHCSLILANGSSGRDEPFSRLHIDSSRGGTFYVTLNTDNGPV